MRAGRGRQEAVSWRGWLAFAVVGCALALAYRHDWTAAAGAAACVLLPVSAWARSRLLATRRIMRGLAGMAALAASYPAAVGTPALPSGAPELFP
jgi:hypothetical protein